MKQTIQIRNYKLPKAPRVFDVTINENGDILRYDIQNIKGNVFIEEQEVIQQIKEALMKKAV